MTGSVRELDVIVKTWCLADLLLLQMSDRPDNLLSGVQTPVTLRSLKPRLCFLPGARLLVPVRGFFVVIVFSRRVVPNFQSGFYQHRPPKTIVALKFKSSVEKSRRCRKHRLRQEPWLLSSLSFNNRRNSIYLFNLKYFVIHFDI